MQNLMGGFKNNYDPPVRASKALKDQPPAWSTAALTGGDNDTAGQMDSDEAERRAANDAAKKLRGMFTSDLNNNRASDSDSDDDDDPSGQGAL